MKTTERTTDIDDETVRMDGLRLTPKQKLNFQSFIFCLFTHLSDGINVYKC